MTTAPPTNPNLASPEPLTEADLPRLPSSAPREFDDLRLLRPVLAKVERRLVEAGRAVEVAEDEEQVAGGQAALSNDPGVLIGARRYTERMREELWEAERAAVRFAGVRNELERRSIEFELGARTVMERLSWPEPVADVRERYLNNPHPVRRQLEAAGVLTGRGVHEAGMMS